MIHFFLKIFFIISTKKKRERENNNDDEKMGNKVDGVVVNTKAG